jgi:hypothetical protein
MLCLLHTKSLQVDDIIAPSLYPAITLTSRIYDHEKGIVRHILSYVGPDQESAHNEAALHQTALQALTSHQQTIASQQQKIAELTAALASTSGGPSSKRARSE